MSRRAIRENIQLETGSIGPTEREGQYRSRELNIFPYCPTKTNAIIYLLFRLKIIINDSSLNYN